MNFNLRYSRFVAFFCLMHKFNGYLPYGMPDNAEVALQDNDILFLRRNMKLAEIENKNVQIVIQTISWRLQASYVFIGPFPPVRLVVTGCGLYISVGISFGRNKFLLLFLCGRFVRVLSSPGGGTVEEGFFYSVLCYVYRMLHFRA